jgi:hypothetical protein
VRWNSFAKSQGHDGLAANPQLTTTLPYAMEDSASAFSGRCAWRSNLLGIRGMTALKRTERRGSASVAERRPSSEARSAWTKPKHPVLSARSAHLDSAEYRFRDDEKVKQPEERSSIDAILSGTDTSRE